MPRLRKGPPVPTDQDPLAEDEGPCTRCTGGWIDVQPSYATHLFPDPTMEDLDGLDDATVAVVWARIEGSRRAALNSVYPCRRCNRAMFFRWADGHLKFGHDALRCPECIEVMGGKRAAARAAKALDLTGAAPRKDLDG